MSRTARSYPRRRLLVTGLVLVGLAASAATTEAHSSTPDRALLNRIPAATYRLVAAGNQSPTALDGDRARIGVAVRTCDPTRSEVRSESDAQPKIGDRGWTGDRVSQQTHRR